MIYVQHLAFKHFVWARIAAVFACVFFADSFCLFVCVSQAHMRTRIAAVSSTRTTCVTFCSYQPLRLLVCVVRFACLSLLFGIVLIIPFGNVITRTHKASNRLGNQAAYQFVRSTATKSKKQQQHMHTCIARHFLEPGPLPDDGRQGY